MARTKGSRNRPKSDVASQITEKQETIASLNTEIASITANIDTLKADLKAKKAALRKAEKEVATLEAKKAKADAKAAEEAKKAEAESVLKKLLAEGMSADECRLSIGNPVDIQLKKDSRFETWFYNGRTLEFENGTLQRFK